MTALLSDITSAKELLDSLNTFEKFSGLKMNVSKTKAMWIGTMKNSVEKPLGLEWCMTVKNLGVQFRSTIFLQSESGIAKFSGNVRQNSESYKYLEHERFIFIWASDNC